MHQIFLYLVFIYYSANLGSAHCSANVQVNLTQICSEQVTVKEILSTVLDIFRNLETSAKKMNNYISKQVV